MTQVNKKNDSTELSQNEVFENEEEQSKKQPSEPEVEKASPEEPPLKEVPSMPAAEEEVKLLKDQLLRALAEAENIRKRAQREKEDTARYAIANFARDLLTVSDNLTRALENLAPEKNQENDVFSSILEGIQITERELYNVLERYGVKKVSPLGEPFDHNYHQAMFEEESSEYEPGKVCRVLQTGYVLHDRLLRPALVGVAKTKASS